MTALLTISIAGFLTFVGVAAFLLFFLDMLLDYILDN